MPITDRASEFAARYPLIRLLRQGSSRFNLKLVAVTGVSGLSSAMLLVTVNAAAEEASNAAANTWYFALFILIMATYAVAQRHILLTTVTEVEHILDRIRINLADRLRGAGLITIEHLGRSRIYAGLTRDTQTISQATGVLMISSQSLLLVVFSVLYLAWLSRLAFVLTALVAFVGLRMHGRHAETYRTLLREAAGRENSFVDSVAHMLDGFKEVKLSEPRGNALFEHLRTVSSALADTKVRAGASLVVHFMFAQAAFYVMIAVVVFLLPQFTPTYAAVVTKATASILFIIGPLSAVVSAFPLFATANVAAQNLFDLEDELSRAGSEPAAGAAVPATVFHTITARDIAYEYFDKDGTSLFKLGPTGLTLHRGEILFLVGGNGSGKSTLLKVLTGLYPQESGSLSIDGLEVTRERLAWYRSHFSAVYSDYHLFDRTYGLTLVPEKVNELLKLLQLDHKTKYEVDRFTNLDLSTGQRKRLALAVSLLENRPILVFDEVAADQDPQFREYFYSKLLPELKQVNKTIICVSHDDRYFSKADRILKLDYGQIVPLDTA
jgi:putative ATP-binding cassette transporter